MTCRRGGGRAQAQGVCHERCCRRQGCCPCETHRRQHGLNLLGEERELLRAKRIEISLPRAAHTTLSVAVATLEQRSPSAPSSETGAQRSSALLVDGVLAPLIRADHAASSSTAHYVVRGAPCRPDVGLAVASAAVLEPGRLREGGWRPSARRGAFGRGRDHDIRRRRRAQTSRGARLFASPPPATRARARSNAVTPSGC